MAPTLFSKIKIRRGLRDDLPDLSESELGFTTDTGEVYIGAPELPSLVDKGRNEPDEQYPYKNVQIVTTTSEHTEILDYNYKSNSPLIAQTGVHPSLPVFRTYQQKFDDLLNLDDFVTNSIDISEDLNRAMRENVNLRKIINISSNDYIIDTPVKIPPNTTLKGEGIDHTFLFHTNNDPVNGPKYLFETIDSFFQESLEIGFNGATLPQNIIVQDMTIIVPRFMDFFRLNRASNITFKNVKFVSLESGPSNFYAFKMDRLGEILPITNIMVDNCTFVNVGNIFNPFTDPYLDVSVMNSKFGNPSNIATLNNDGFENFKFINNLVVGIDGDAIIATRGKNLLSTNNVYDVRTSDPIYSPIRIDSNFISGQSIQDKFYLNTNMRPVKNGSNSTVFIPTDDFDMIFNGIEKSGRNAFSIEGEQTDIILPMFFNVLEYYSVVFNITLKRNGRIIQGRLEMVQDGSNVYLIDNTFNIGSETTTFDAIITNINGSDSMCLTYTTPDAGDGILLCNYEAIRT